MVTDKSIQQGLEQDARLIKERIPNKMTRQAISDVRLRLREFIGQQGFSQKKIAQMVSVSNSAISQFLNNKYKGDAELLSKKLHDLMESCARRDRQPHGKAFIKTAIAKRIFTVIAETDAFSDDNEGKIGVVIGDSGHGKSVCLKQYAQTNKNTIYVALDDAQTPTILFASIAKELGLDASGSRATVTRRLIDNLQNRHMIILLDEASHLSVKELNLLRQIIVIKSRCPLILAGNRHLVNTIMQPITRRGCESLDQFVSRLMYILDLDAVASEKDSGLYTVEDIRRLYEYGGIKLTGDAVTTLRKIANTPRSGRLHTCKNIITACHLSKKVQKRGQINTTFILSAITDLNLPVKVFLPFILEKPTRLTETETAVKAG